MIDTAPLGSFVALSAIIILAPGSDVLLLIRSSLSGGRRIGFATFIGIHLGNLVLTTAVATGLGAAIARHESLLMVIRLAGALYLVWLAIVCARAVWAQYRQRSSSAGSENLPVDHPGWLAAFRRGFITNVTNPKVLIFYLSFLPQFLGHAANIFLQMEVLSLIFISLAMMWEAGVVLLATSMRRVLDRPKFGMVFDALSAIVFLGLATVVLIEF